MQAATFLSFCVGNYVLYFFKINKIFYVKFSVLEFSTVS